jgi:competence protein ComEA
MPEYLLQRRRLLLAVAVSLALVLLLGRFALGAGTTTPAASLPPPPAGEVNGSGLSSSRVVVDVVGAVRRPGLYRLPQRARIADAVARAGGTTAKADLAQVNLAAPVADGEQIVVPRQGIAAPTSAATAAGSSSAPVQLSTATLEQLDSLPGVGPVTAQKILDYRQEHGAFHSVDELDAVPGIGPKRLDQLRELVVP